MYSANQIIRGFKNPSKIIDELRRVRYRASFATTDGVDIMAEDWDNLIILDACRFDLFEERNEIDGQLCKVQSKGSMTMEWLENNFDGGSYPDTVFVSGNPNLANIDASFAEIVPVWQVDWDHKKGTARPKAMVRQTVAAHKRNPKKRLISMFVQPHTPYLGPTGEKIEGGEFTGGGVICENEKTKSVWTQIHNGELDPEIVYKAYEENFNMVLPYIKEVISKLDGKTVVTADHGEAFGEYGLYGHPREIHIPELIEVPWLEIDSTRRKEVTSVKESKLDYTNNSGGKKIEDRLSDLGYR